LDGHRPEAGGWREEDGRIYKSMKDTKKFLAKTLKRDNYYLSRKREKTKARKTADNQEKKNAPRRGARGCFCKQSLSRTKVHLL
jgi:hypothetical protein